MKICARHIKNACAATHNPQILTQFSSDRRASDGLTSECKSCAQKNRLIRKELYAASASAYYLNNAESKCEKMRQRYLEKKEEILGKNQQYRTENKLKRKTYDLVWRAGNRGKCNFSTAKYKAKKLQATPKWLSKDQMEEIRRFYISAAQLTKATGVEHQVDHILPLQNENLCGLHVPWNLQILTKSQNCKKRNKLILSG